MKKKNIYKSETFQAHFEDYRITKIDKRIYNESIHNFDKTEF